MSLLRASSRMIRIRPSVSADKERDRQPLQSSRRGVGAKNRTTGRFYPPTPMATSYPPGPDYASQPGSAGLRTAEQLAHESRLGAVGIKGSRSRGKLRGV